MNNDKERYRKGLAVALAVHMLAGVGLGACVLSDFDKKQNIIEVTLAPAGKKPKAAAQKPKPKPIIKPPRKDDIIDKRLKPPPKVEEQQPDPPETDDNSNTDNTGQSDNEGEAGHGQGDAGDGAGAVPVQRPFVIYSVKPPYPSDAKARKSTGTVHLRVLVEPNGKASEVSVASSSGDGSLDAAAVNSLYKWRFSPAKNAKGQAIRCYVTVPVTFVLN